VIVVSNTSPITNLAAIGEFGLLREIYGEINIPEAVWNELNAAGTVWPGRDAVAESDWVHRHAVSNATAVQVLLTDLDRGEAESIVLAIELGADALLLDEAEGRHHAQRLGLRTVGVIGTLVAAKQRGHITALRPHLDALRSIAGFYIGAGLYQSVLEVAGE
jgi:predicted nucleic acid-binding protein